MKIIIHGGFFSEFHTDNQTKKAKQDALQEIARKGFEYLKGHSALETVVYTVSLLEDDELFNAGIGSQIQSDGKIRMSASVMDGSTLRMSGVINIEEVKNPVQVAEQLLGFEDKILSGEGATNFARKMGFAPFSTEIPQRRQEYLAKLKSAGTGTVGCVALDSEGRLAAATSTGGKGFEIPCRVSDSATVAGNYANRYCAVSCTGVGEDIVGGAVAAKIVTRVSDGMPIEKAFERTFEELKEIDGFAGAIGIDGSGNFCYLDSHPSMVFASYDGEEFVVFG